MRRVKAKAAIPSKAIVLGSGTGAMVYSVAAVPKVVPEEVAES